MKTNPTGPTWLFYCYAALFVFLPWSPEFNAGTWRIRLPAEALTLLTGLGVAYSLFRHPEWLQTVQRRGLVLWASAVWIMWLTISLLFSTMPVVSLKYWLVETGQWWVFFGAMMLFRDWWLRLLPFFVYSMIGIVLFTLAHHFQYNFRADQSMLAPMPFFPDHTLLSAVVVMLLPILYVVFSRRIASLVMILFAIALYFAHCRAAWMSIAAASLVLIPFVFFKQWTWRIAFFGTVLLTGILLQPALLEKIKQDVSMLERLNRYACAGRMAAERPFTGYGPGTFQFQYLPFQQPDEMTRISVTDPEKDLQPNQYGRGGGAHSEYLQALAENGWLGLVLWLLLAGGAVFTGIKWYWSAQNKQDQWMAFAITFSLLTYFFHAFLNHFLHDGRVALLFWGQVAMLRTSLR